MPKYILLILIAFIYSVPVPGETLFTSYQKSAPKFFMQEGQMTGLCYDIIHELNNRLKAKGIVIASKQEQVKPLKRILHDLEYGKIDLFVGMSRNKQREAIYHFADQPLYELSEVFVKRKSDLFEYIDKQSLQGLKIVSLRGSNTANRIFSVDRVQPYRSDRIENALTFLLRGRADLAYYHNLGVEYIIKNMGISDQVVVVQKPFRQKYHYIGFSKKVSPKLIQDINHALIAMHQDKVIEKMRLKYK